MISLIIIERTTMYYFGPHEQPSAPVPSDPS